MTKKLIGLGLVALAVALSGCAQAPEEVATPEFDTDYVPVVSVTGEVVPSVWAVLSAQTGGIATEVLVKSGDELSAGDVLVRLDPTDAQLAVKEAETAVNAAQAQLALVKVDPLREDIAVAEAQITAAEAVIAQAIAARDEFKAGVTTAEIAAARAQLAAAEAEQRAAWEQHDETMKCFQVTQPDGTKRKVCPALGTLEELARLSLHAADEAVAASQAQINALTASADDRLNTLETGIQLAEAQLGVAQAQLDLAKAATPAEEITVAQATIDQAQAALDAALVLLQRYELRAPISGTVGAVDVRVGEMISPGEPLITVGDLSTLRVETTDLDEIDVARVTVGQEAGVTFDALPDQLFTGQVTHISPMAESGTGGVNYTVVVELEGFDPLLRWGMTAFVDIQVE